VTATVDVVRLQGFFFFFLIFFTHVFMHFDKAVGDASRFSPYQNEFKYPTAIEVACFSTCFSRFGNGMASEYTSYLLSLCTFFGGCT